ncbi:MAG: N-acetylmuramoyl-L-alanine amidase [Gemmatimonadetes bacterium]|nr:MAG: N-acetylmuramoyl-L-alanine amidase [Gemmatimonadota bacterium]
MALAVALALADELDDDPRFDVRLTREDDRLVPLWERGRLATEWRGERPGVFVSIHANAAPRSPEVRGFETYFLSEARTEHEERVAALENAPLQLEDDATGEDPDLDFILRELRNLDTQHWSALLAQMVQERMAEVHPGPDRGVKQAPLAVITNALMPAVLVELGYLTNRDEARLLADRDFQRDAARALAEAIRAFFERYPPGPSSGG